MALRAKISIFQARTASHIRVFCAVLILAFPKRVSVYFIACLIAEGFSKNGFMTQLNYPFNA